MSSSCVVCTSRRLCRNVARHFMDITKPLTFESTWPSLAKQGWHICKSSAVPGSASKVAPTKYFWIIGAMTYTLFFVNLTFNYGTSPVCKISYILKLCTLPFLNMAGKLKACVYLALTCVHIRLRIHILILLYFQVCTICQHVFSRSDTYVNDRDLVKEKASKMLKTKQVSHKAKRRDSYEGKNIVRSKVNLSQLSVASFLFFALSPCLPA